MTVAVSVQGCSLHPADARLNEPIRELPVKPDKLR
jgi:hypothetical protein